MLFDKHLKDSKVLLKLCLISIKYILIPKVTIDEDEFVRLKRSDFVSSGISSEMLGPGDIWGDTTVTITLVGCIESFSLDPFLDRLAVFELPFGPKNRINNNNWLLFWNL